ncbi:MAG: acyl-CoA thioesterase [Planctomycetes bacterium]|jgi:acyl-CoA thioester hydrolase|nr:acyl-CoA thioesterase [Planctomycetota bacterium]
MAYRHRIRVRYGETDRMGVVHHSVHPLYFEEARTALMRSLGFPYAELERSGYLLPLTEFAVSFRRGARYDDEVDIEVSMESVGRVRLRLRYRMVRVPDGELLAEGHTEHASVGPDFRPRRLPEEVVRAFGTAVSREED